MLVKSLEVSHRPNYQKWYNLETNYTQRHSHYNFPHSFSHFWKKLYRHIPEIKGYPFLAFFFSKSFLKSFVFVYCRSAVMQNFVWIRCFLKSRMFYFKQKRFTFLSKSEFRVACEQCACLHFSRYSCSPGSICCHSRQTQTHTADIIWYL